ncbi:MAG: hypothetical protein JO264_13340 [Acidisphaera sp.]|nr:hypothetical protein [Acidisphaera sp.]
MSMGSTQPFRVSATATLTAGAASANLPLVGTGEAVLIYNASPAIAFVRFGTDMTVTATAADMPVPPGMRLLMHTGGFATTAAAVLASGNGIVFFSRGEGTVY